MSSFPSVSCTSGTAFPIILFCHLLIIVLSCSHSHHLYLTIYTLSVSVFIVDSLFIVTTLRVSAFCLLLVCFMFLDCLSGILTLCLDWFCEYGFPIKILHLDLTFPVCVYRDNFLIID